MPDESGARNHSGEPDSWVDLNDPPVVLLFMESGRNRELISDTLSKEYRVETKTEQETFDENFDCCIVDNPGYNRMAGTFESKRDATKPAFQPYVLLVKDGTLDGMNSKAWEHFDDVIELPISKDELRTRIGNLIERRRTVSELAKRERELGDERDKLAAREQQLERQNEQLESFAGIVSHDLRDPLKIAEGHLELAREQHENEDLEKVSQALDRMYLLIDDLLELARVGDQVSDIETVDLTAAVERSWQNVDSGRATLRTEKTRTIQADRSRLLQLFENLFRNAIEHAGADVTVTVGPLDDGFYIEDDGEGIPEESRDEVFDMGHTSNPEGTGFGLSIVKEVVEAHDWTIQINTGSDGGARFEITGVEFLDK